MQNRYYPKLHIRSKNELAKHLSHSKFSKADALVLINDVLTNFDSYWRDNKSQSKPEKGKYVRSAKRTPLGRLLDNINKSVLAPHDALLPNFIFGGVQGLNHAKAVEHLLGRKRKRVLLKLDITRFFEQIREERVLHFFQDKCGCNNRAAKLLAGFCCVSAGQKDNPEGYKTIARGFATSSRLAVWCNLEAFIKLDRLVRKRLKGKDPRIAVYVDDIGITASRVSVKEMENLYKEIQELFAMSDKNQTLPLNDEKMDIISHEQTPEHLGLRMHRNRLAIGAKARSRLAKAKTKSKRKARMRYKKYVESFKQHSS